MASSRRLAALLLAGLWVPAGAVPAGADVLGASETALELRYAVTVAAPPDRAWATLIAPARWWNPAHSYSGQAANFTLDARPGGCFCEAAMGGGVEHLRVVVAAPAKLLRMTGGLGPFQGEAVVGTMTFELSAAGAGTALVMTYRLGGQRDGGFAPIAAGVDAVLADQIARLKAAAERAR